MPRRNSTPQRAATDSSDRRAPVRRRRGATGRDYTCAGVPVYRGLVYGPCMDCCSDPSGLFIGTAMLALYPFIAVANGICGVFYSASRAATNFFG